MAHELELLAIDAFRCPACKAQAGIGCSTPRGMKRAPHDSRLALAQLRRVELARLAKWTA